MQQRDQSPLKASTSLQKDEYLRILEWLGLDVEAISWDGLNRQDFQVFWQLFFSSTRDGEINFKILRSRFEMAKSILESGPLVRWFIWLEEKTLIYFFLFKNYSLQALEDESGHSVSYLALILHNYFRHLHPQQRLYLDKVFHLDPYSEKAAELSYAQLEETLPVLNGQGVVAQEESIMKTLEITLYPEWQPFVTQLKSHFGFNVRTTGKKKRTKTGQSLFQFFRDVSMFLAVGCAAVLLIKYGNTWYESLLSAEIQVLESSQFRFSRESTFQSEEQVRQAKKIQTSLKDYQQQEAAQEKSRIANLLEERFDPESEVELTSIDSLPKDFSVVSLEKSSYEEEEKGGHRDSTYGLRKAYRVLMKSVNPDSLGSSIDSLLLNYQVKQVDSVTPGKQIPGGVYYNLYVPKQNLKRFLAQVGSIEESTLFESRTRVGAPPNMVRVFIWIKNI